MKLLKALFKLVFYYFVSVGFVAFGWNVILTKIMNVLVYNFGELCLLTLKLALSFIATPITLGLHYPKDKE